MSTWIVPPARLRELLQPRMRYRVTAAGVLFLLALVLTGLAAFLSGNNLLFLVFAAMLALLLVSGFLSRLVIAGLELELQLPEHVSAGTPTAARILIRNLKKIIPSFSIELTGAAMTKTVYLPLLPGGATVEAPVELVFPHRGRHRESLFLLSTKFPFGFIRRTTPVALHRETIVYPCLDNPQPGIDLLLDSLTTQIAQSRGAGREFHSIRAYETLDDVRHIDWKSTAHTGALQVREFARDHQSSVEIHFDRRNPQNEAAFEDLVEQCASLAWRLSLRNIEIWFHSQDFASDGATIYDILVYLSLVEPVDSMAATVEFPPNDANLQVVFSAHPDDFQNARIVGPRAR